MISALAVGDVLSTGASTTLDPKKVDVSIVILTPLPIAELTLDVEPLARWTNPIIAALESQFRDEPKPRTVVVQVTLHSKGPADVAVAGRPAPNADEIKNL